MRSKHRPSKATIDDLGARQSLSSRAPSLCAGKGSHRGTGLSASRTPAPFSPDFILAPPFSRLIRRRSSSRVRPSAASAEVKGAALFSPSHYAVPSDSPPAEGGRPWPKKRWARLLLSPKPARPREHHVTCADRSNSDQCNTFLLSPVELFLSPAVLLSPPFLRLPSTSCSSSCIVLALSTPSLSSSTELSPVTLRPDDRLLVASRSRLHRLLSPPGRDGLVRRPDGQQLGATSGFQDM